MPALQRPGVADFYEREVLPALMDRLDQAFPEFGWRRDARGWVATSAEYTRSTLGARPDRVVCHGEAPRGFLIHGQGAVLWTSYLNDGQPARGRDFIVMVRTLAERAGVDASVLDRARTSAARRGSLLAEAFAVAQHELASERGGAARAYLEERGIPADRISASELGVMPSHERLRAALLSGGYTASEIDSSQLLADNRWPGRIIGAWRDDHRHIRTLWARSIDPDDASRYLYLRSAERPSDVPYTLSELLAPQTRDARGDLVLVEGVLDVHTLHAHDVPNVAALGGLAASRRLFEHLSDLGVERAFLALDNDPPGRLATTRAIDTAVLAERSPDLWVIDPDLLDGAKDPGELVQRDGVHAWRAATAAPACAVTWRALELTGPLDQHTSELARRAALNRAATWLGPLPPRLALEQDAALDRVAETLGHDRDATRRSFRARYWQQERSLDTSKQIRAPGR
jgi:DNA primase